MTTSNIEKRPEHHDEKLPAYRTEAVSTWHDLAGHWLRAPTGESLDVTAARRLAAVQRWRGLAQDGAQL